MGSCGASMGFNTLPENSGVSLMTVTLFLKPEVLNSIPNPPKPQSHLSKQIS